jgi:hypothetical protein
MDGLFLCSSNQFLTFREYDQSPNFLWRFDILTEGYGMISEKYHELKEKIFNK